MRRQWTKLLWVMTFLTLIFTGCNAGGDGPSKQAPSDNKAAVDRDIEVDAPDLYQDPQYGIKIKATGQWRVEEEQTAQGRLNVTLTGTQNDARVVLTAISKDNLGTADFDQAVETLRRDLIGALGEVTPIDEGATQIGGLVGRFQTVETNQSERIHVELHMLEGRAFYYVVSHFVQAAKATSADQVFKNLLERLEFHNSF